MEQTRYGNGDDNHVKLIVKAPNQEIDDEIIECTLEWTVARLKDHLAQVYPTKPVRLFLFQSFIRLINSCLLFSQKILFFSIIFSPLYFQFRKLRTIALVLWQKIHWQTVCVQSFESRSIVFIVKKSFFSRKMFSPQWQPLKTNSESEKHTDWQCECQNRSSTLRSNEFYTEVQIPVLGSS